MHSSPRMRHLLTQVQYWTKERRELPFLSLNCSEMMQRRDSGTEHFLLIQSWSNILSHLNTRIYNYSPNGGECDLTIPTLHVSATRTGDPTGWKQLHTHSVLDRHTSFNYPCSGQVWGLTGYTEGIWETSVWFFVVSLTAILSCLMSSITDIWWGLPLPTQCFLLRLTLSLA